MGAYLLRRAFGQRVRMAAVSPLLQAQEDPLRTLYFPDYADGGGWCVQLAISNIDTTEDAATFVAAYDHKGQEIPSFFSIEDIYKNIVTKEYTTVIEQDGDYILDAKVSSI